MAVKGQIEPWKILLILLGAGGFGVLLWLLIVNINSKKPYTSSKAAGTESDFKTLMAAYNAELTRLRSIVANRGNHILETKPGFADLIFQLRQQLLTGGYGSDDNASCRSFAQVRHVIDNVFIYSKNPRSLREYYNGVMVNNRPTGCPVVDVNSNGMSGSWNVAYAMQEYADEMSLSTTPQQKAAIKLSADAFSVRNGAPFIELFMGPIFVPSPQPQSGVFPQGKACASMSKDFMTQVAIYWNFPYSSTTKKAQLVKLRGMLDNMASQGCIDPVNDTTMWSFIHGSPLHGGSNIANAFT